MRSLHHIILLLSISICVVMLGPSTAEAKAHASHAKKSSKKNKKITSKKESRRRALAKRQVAAAKQARDKDLAKNSKKRSSYFPGDNDTFDANAEISGYASGEDSGLDFQGSGNAEEIRESIYLDSKPQRRRSVANEDDEFRYFDK